MPIKNRSQAYYEKKAKRLQVMLDDAIETRHRVQREYQEFKAHSHEVLTSHLGKIRRQDETLASNNMTIQELNDQVAVQWKQRAEARSDVERAERFAHETAEKHNKLAFQLEDADQKLRNARRERDDISATWHSTLLELAEAKRTLRYRIWVGVTRSTSYLQAWLSSKALRLKNRWFIRRLSKARVTAMQEAGYIPEKLIKVAHRYWEADRERINGNVYTEVQTTVGPRTIIEKPSWLQKWKIWRGRA